MQIYSYKCKYTVISVILQYFYSCKCSFAVPKIQFFSYKRVFQIRFLACKFHSSHAIRKKNHVFIMVLSGKITLLPRLYLEKKITFLPCMALTSHRTFTQKENCMKEPQAQGKLKVLILAFVIVLTSLLVNAVFTVK